MEYRAEFLVQGITWTAIWGQGSLMLLMPSIPLAIGAPTAQGAVSEYEGRS